MENVSDRWAPNYNFPIAGIVTAGHLEARLRAVRDRGSILAPVETVSIARALAPSAVVRPPAAESLRPAVLTLS